MKDKKNQSQEGINELPIVTMEKKYNSWMLDRHDDNRQLPSNECCIDFGGFHFASIFEEEALREYESESTYEIKSRGTVIVVKSDVEGSRNILKNLINTLVNIDGVTYKVKGVESFATINVHLGQLIGLLVESWPSSKFLSLKESEELNEHFKNIEDEYWQKYFNRGERVWEDVDGSNEEN